MVSAMEEMHEREEEQGILICFLRSAHIPLNHIVVNLVNKVFFFFRDWILDLKKIMNSN